MAADKQAGVWACTIITFIPATLTFILRFYARSLKQIPLWWDDYLAILAFVRISKESLVMKKQRC